MKIGIVGSGKLGGQVGRLWSQAGHDVLFSSRHPDTLDDLVRAAGGTARSGTPDEAIAFGEVLLVSIPFCALPEFAQTKREAVGRKILLETANPYPERDGELANEVRQPSRGTGLFLREWFPGMRIVRAFNSVWDQTLGKEAHRPEPRVGIPLASDDEEALRVASKLVIDAGFDPVIVGTLDRARESDVGTPVYSTGMSGPEVRAALGLSAGRPFGSNRLPSEG